jgi:flagellar hook-basal body complex protein FliE
MIAGMNAMTGVTTSAAQVGKFVESLPTYAGTSRADGATPFSDLLADAAGQVTALENGARAAVQGLMTGSGVDVHEAMIASERASMAFEMALAVRNKAVQAYQSVMAMQF